MDPSRTKDFEGLVSVVCEGFKDSFQAAWGLDTRKHEPTPTCCRSCSVKTASDLRAKMLQQSPCLTCLEDFCTVVGRMDC